MSNVVYVVHAVGTPFIKIGVSSDVPKRIKTLQTGCPHELKLVGYASSESVTATHLKSRIKKNLSPYKARGEWFNMTGASLDDLKRIVGLASEKRIYPQTGGPQ